VNPVGLCAPSDITMAGATSGSVPIGTSGE